MQFDKRGVKVAHPATLQKIAQAVADCLCNVPISQVKYGGTLGQSTLLNHQVGSRAATCPRLAARHAHKRGCCSSPATAPQQCCG